VLDCVRILGEVRRHVDAVLWMAGDGPDRGPAERLARELGLEPHLEFLGKQDHVERLIPQAHVLLLPSQMESFGLAALEAMACGVPPVATHVGGLPELVTHGVDGFLEPPGDVASQAAAVVALLTDEALYERVSAAARQTAATKFCASLLIPEYEAFYGEVCG
jgi:N-acetyl-alpha-D-glucosaminyl L-malate synthase BshA